MAREAKTRVEAQSVEDFLTTVTPPERQAEARRLVAIFSEVTGFAPRLWSGGMVGFGRYDYTYASGHSGRALATGFAPRKAEISIYIMPGYTDFSAILSRLGKHRKGRACLYLRRLSDADEAVLRELIAAGLADLASRWEVQAL